MQLSQAIVAIGSFRISARPRAVTLPLADEYYKSYWLLNIASIAERADEQVLAAVYLFIGRSLSATNIGATRVWGIAGWRFAFQLLAAVSVLTSALVWRYARNDLHGMCPAAACGGAISGRQLFRTSPLRPNVPRIILFKLVVGPDQAVGVPAHIRRTIGFRVAQTPKP